VDIASHPIKLNDRPARLIVVNNITARRKAQTKLLQQNTQLREIAQLSSHELRGPVASILGLVSLFDKNNQDRALNNQIIENLKTSAGDLDKVIHQIVKKTHEEGK
jgi:signal transduction histidine kinase